jgi:flavin-dependent dehydrogenase
MLARMDSYDAIVVGASIGGCTAARLLAQAGARVALVDRSPDPEAYKTVCTHYIQPSATPTIERLGLAALIEESGGIRNSVELWTPYSGWVIPRGRVPHGYNITRKVLDPMLRSLAAGTAGVEYMPGLNVVGVSRNGRVTGVEVETQARDRRRLSARLVVGADGRDSSVASLAEMPGKVKPHRRFFYWAYWTGLDPGRTRSRMWMLDPDFAYLFPNEGGQTIVLTAPHESRLPEFRADLEGAYMRDIARLPDAPDLSGATRTSKVLGKLKLPNVMRRAAQPGLALVGDAALASDPLWGVGCGWAFQSAEWLADAVAPALGSSGDLDSALARYAKQHRRRLGPHHFLIADIASGRRANPFERAMYRAAGRDEKVFHAFEAIGSRRRSPATLFDPRVLARIVRSGIAVRGHG